MLTSIFKYSWRELTTILLIRERILIIECLMIVEKYILITTVIVFEKVSYKFI